MSKLREAFDEIKAAFLKETKEFAVSNIEGVREDVERWGANYFEALSAAAAESDPITQGRLLDGAWALLDQLQEAARLRVAADGMRRLKEFGQTVFSLLVKLVV